MISAWQLQRLKPGDSVIVEVYIDEKRFRDMVTAQDNVDHDKVMLGSGIYSRQTGLHVGGKLTIISLADERAD